MDRHEPDAPTRVELAPFRCKRRGHRIHLRSRLRQRHVRLQPRNRERIPAARLAVGFGEGEWRPELGRFTDERPSFEEERNVGRHDADDRECAAVQLDRVSDDRRIAAETPLP